MKDNPVASKCCATDIPLNHFEVTFLCEMYLLDLLSYEIGQLFNGLIFSRLLVVECDSLFGSNCLRDVNPSSFSLGLYEGNCFIS